jgi:5-methylcytosine-specific restriction enzyme B
MPRDRTEIEILEAAARWRDRCLAADGSVFTDHAIWTAANVDQLNVYFAENLDLGEGTFWEKLQRQLKPASPAAKQLAAEMFWVMYVIVYREAMTAETKRLQISKVWEWSGEAMPDRPFELGTVLETGVAHPGTSYNTNRWRELQFFIQLMKEWKALPEPRIAALLEDPWTLGAWIDDLEASKGRQLRHVLLYLLFPDHYDPIVTSRHKRDIVKAFYAEWGEDDAHIDYKRRLTMDQEIVKVRDRLAEEYGDRELNFYEDPLVQVWKGGTVTPPLVGKVDAWYNATFRGARTWAIAAGQGARFWPEFQAEGIVAIGWDYLGDLSEYDSIDQVRDRIAEETGKTNPVNDTLACWQFAHEMQPGDQVIVKRGGGELLGWGVIQSEYRHEPARSEYEHVRSVKWVKAGSWSLPSNRQITIKTLTEFTRWTEWLFFAWELIHGGDTVEPQPPGRYTLDDAADGVFMELDALRDILDTFARRKNLILQGPPGVGKTFIARRLAYALINYRRPDQVQLVQFHQSYGYEDFVQGWRPAAGGGFALQDGIFHRFAGRARSQPDSTFVLIIDEINRGNLSKVFGELLMLIESDKRSPDYAVALTYSPDAQFYVPPNLHIIGLMNTADRSLAMVDFALRRRFGFVSLAPAFDSDTFANILSTAGASQDLIATIRDRFNELNAAIESDSRLGGGFRIGHSFFVPQGEDTSLDEGWYRSIVNNEILPLLGEYWFDDPNKVGVHAAKLLA